MSAAHLMQRVSVAIDNEIQTSVHETEVDDQEYLECANWYVNVFVLLEPISFISFTSYIV